MSILSVSKYRKEHIVKTYEADVHGVLRVVSLMNVLQDIAVEHADSLGFGFKECMKQGIVWVGANYFIDILRLPKIGEKFTIETWPAEAKLWGAIRDFIIYGENDDIIVKASSLWVLVDFVKKRPVLMKKFFPEYKAINDRILKTDFEKMLFPDTVETTSDYKVRFDDIDVNNHVNNAIYPLWATESVDMAYRNTHQPCEIEIVYQKEALFGEDISVLTSWHENQSYHIIKSKQSDAELSRCRIKWRKLH